MNSQNPKAKKRIRVKPIPAIAKPLEQLSQALSPTMSTERMQLEEAFASIQIDDQVFQVVEVRATGDVILDVTFPTSLECEKSIEGGDRAIIKMKEEAEKTGKPLPSIRRLYRVRLDTMKKKSKYFEQLLGSQIFSEGIRVTNTHAVLEESQSPASKAPAELLPRLEIEDEDDATRTMGRDKVFEDLLRILHDGHHFTESKYIGLHYVAVLVTMADRFDCMEPIAKYMNAHLARIKYPPNTSEEIIRKKILILSLANFTPRLANSTLESCTKELILQGSVYWLSSNEDVHLSSARWWNLPLGLEDELAYRRQQILLALSSLLTHFLDVYTSKDRQCALGYDSSPACDSFQLGEMIKFLKAKKLLSLTSFSGIGPNHPNYEWPDAYAGSLEDLVNTLHQVPPYQVDSHHRHCGLRGRILKPLEHIQACMTYGSGIQASRWHNDRDGQTWIIPEPDTKKKPFIVVDQDIASADDGVEEMDEDDVRYWAPDHEKLKDPDDGKHIFRFAKNGQISLGGGVLGTQLAARKLFMAEEWDWRSDKDVPVGEERLGRAFGSIQGGRGRRGGLFGR